MSRLSSNFFHVLGRHDNDTAISRLFLVESDDLLHQVFFLFCRDWITHDYGDGTILVSRRIDVVIALVIGFRLLL